MFIEAAGQIVGLLHLGQAYGAAGGFLLLPLQILRISHRSYYENTLILYFARIATYTSGAWRNNLEASPDLES